MTIQISRDDTYGPVQLRPGRIHTARLELVPADAALLRADLAGPDALAAALDAEVRPGWRDAEWDEAATRWVLERMESGAFLPGWGTWYGVEATAGLLVGGGGFKGPPDERGVVEIGYAIAEWAQRRGLASEMAGALAAYAFADVRVTVVAVETFPDNEASLGVIRRLGFRPVPGGSEPGVVRFELHREGVAAGH